ncbi:trafficking protein particle complex subunit 6b-like [Diadema setosum]|uniref:trafficking protein particle complex subunit 6b-like n=1 Tax=Diadema antillarum TaxID=105358 RepID=UPI003A866B8D
MADDFIFDFLHMEIVDYVQRSACKDEKDKVISKLEQMGYRVGQSLIEKFTRDSPRFSSELDIIKFVCKDLWNGVYKKQVDNLRTNHQGVYVLQDNKFKLLTQMSAGKQYMESAPRYLAFPCGLIRGALANLGINCVVTAEVSTMPACKFQVMIQRT